MRNSFLVVKVIKYEKYYNRANKTDNLSAVNYGKRECGVTYFIIKMFVLLWSTSGVSMIFHKPKFCSSLIVTRIDLKIQQSFCPIHFIFVPTNVFYAHQCLPKKRQ